MNIGVSVTFVDAPRLNERAGPHLSLYKERILSFQTVTRGRKMPVHLSIEE